MSRQILGSLLVIAGIAVTLPASALAGDTAPQYTREGTLYRIDAATPHQNAAWQILERENDAATATKLASRRVELSIHHPIAVKEVLAMMLQGTGLAANFTGAKAARAANATVGVGVVSGSLLGAIRNLATQTGLNAIVGRDAVTITDYKSFVLTLPAYENAADIARRLKESGAKDITASGSAISFSADDNSLRAVENLVRQFRIARRGVAPFLAAMEIPAPEQSAAAQTRSATQAAEKALVAKLYGQSPSPRGELPAAHEPDPAHAGMAPQKIPNFMAEKPSVTTDPLTSAVVTLNFKGDAIEALRRVADDAGLRFLVMSRPLHPIAIYVRMTNVPLQMALETIGRKLGRRANVTYVAKTRTIEFAGH